MLFITHQALLLAFIAIEKDLAKQAVPLLYRGHREPSPLLKQVLTLLQ